MAHNCGMRARWFGLLLFLSSPAWGQPVNGAVPPGSPSPVREEERRLVGRALPQRVLDQLEVWDQRFTEWRKPEGKEIDASKAPIIVLHLWATWCQPCLAELALWQTLGPNLLASAPGRVRVLHVAIRSGSSDMERFVLQHRARLPAESLHGDVTSELLTTLSTHLAAPSPAAGKRVSASKSSRGVGSASSPELPSLPIPMTLVMNSQRVIQLALVGSVQSRAAELLKVVASTR